MLAVEIEQVYKMASGSRGPRRIAVAPGRSAAVVIAVLSRTLLAVTTSGRFSNINQAVTPGPENRDESGQAATVVRRCGPSLGPPDAARDAQGGRERVRLPGPLRPHGGPRLRRSDDPEGAAFPAQGEERHLLLHGRRRVARRLVRPQAEAGGGRRQGRRPGRQPHREREPEVAQEPVDVPAPRPVGTPRQRALPAHRVVRRRPLRHPLDEGRAAVALDGRALPAHRQQQRRPAQPRLVDQLRARGARTRTCPASWC